MTTLLAQLHDAPRITCDDRVRVPDGRIGETFFVADVEALDA